MNLSRLIIDRINPPYRITDEPDIRVHNPEIELIDINEYRFKIITSKNSRTNKDEIYQDCEKLAVVLKTLEPYVDVFSRRLYTFEIYEDEDNRAHGFVDESEQRLLLNKEYINMSIHELGHILDISQKHSSHVGFQNIYETYKNTYDILKQYQELIDERYERYLLQPREVFARLFQQYYLNNLETDKLFQNIEIDVAEIVAIAVYKQNTELLNEYFDKKFIELYQKTERFQQSITDALYNLGTETHKKDGLML